MNRLWVRFGAMIAIITLMAGGASAAWWSQQDSYSASSGCSWSYWGNYGCYQQQSSSHSSSSGGWGPNWYGGAYENYFSSYYRSSWMTNFWANDTQIADVSGIWETDLLGNLTVRLTGDDIIRGMYTVDDTSGYIQGNFSSEGEPVMDGFWWESPEYRPPYQAGAIQITFENSTSLNGIFSYADGTWGPFTGTKIIANLTQEEDDLLMDMPQLDWTIDEAQSPVMRVDNPVESNPISIP